MNITRYFFSSILFASILLGCTDSTSPGFDPNQVEVQWEVIENGVNGEDRSASAFTLVNQGDAAIPSS